MDPLTDDEIDALKRALLSLRGELSAEQERDTDSADIVDLDTPQGRLSRMDAIQQQRMAQAQKQRLRMRLGQIGQALRAMDNDEYGDCRRCDEPIGLERLTARPEAPFCIDCAEAAERKRSRR